MEMLVVPLGDLSRCTFAILILLNGRRCKFATKDTGVLKVDVIHYCTGHNIVQPTGTTQKCRIKCKAREVSM